MELQEEIRFQNKSVHLCTGNLTKLPIEEKVDVLVVSAFPGDYIPTSASLIGALKFDLNIDLKELANDKHEDLRASLSCWWSKKLPADYAFSRILCFEGNFKHGKTSPHAVGDLYRALVSLCDGKEFSVIMPLLATGDQGYCKPLMLTLLTETALHWMKIGLPLKLLKIVVYDQGIKQEMVETFRDIRMKWLERCRLSKQITAMKFDLYVCYHPHDKEIADGFLNELRSVEENILVCFGEDNATQAAFQKHVFNMMAQCARVVVFLSPHFVSDAACIDQYNMARCCSQILKRDFLLPLYVKNGTPLPAYMQMIQYIDCRYSENMQDMFRTISQDLVIWLKTNKSLIIKRELFQFSSFEELELDAKDGNVKCLQGEQGEDMQYDMFVSYSHQNMKIAHLFVETIQKLKPDWKVFFDSVGLKTGCAWQHKLYESIERSKVFVALTSSDYLLSKVCQEEFNLALALHRDINYSTILIQAAIEIIEKRPSWCANVPSFDFSALDGSMLLKVQALVKAIHCLMETNIPRPTDVLTVKPLLSTWRKLNFQNSNPYTKAHILDSSVQPVKCLDASCSIYLSFHPQDEYYARLLANELRATLSDVSIIHNKCSEKDLKTLGRATLVIPLLSHMYVNNSACMEELNVSLSIQRWADKITCCPVILDSLPLRPAYPNLCFCLFSLTDPFWMEQCLGHTIGGKLSFAEAVKVVCLQAVARFVSGVLDCSASIKCILNVDEISLSIDDLRQDACKTVQNPLHYFPSFKTTDDNAVFGGHKTIVCRTTSGHNSNGTHESGSSLSNFIL